MHRISSLGKTAQMSETAESKMENKHASSISSPKGALCAVCNKSIEHGGLFSEGKYTLLLLLLNLITYRFIGGSTEKLKLLKYI